MSPSQTTSKYLSAQSSYFTQFLKHQLGLVTWWLGNTCRHKIQCQQTAQQLTIFCLIVYVPRVRPLFSDRKTTFTVDLSSHASGHQWRRIQTSSAFSNPKDAKCSFMAVVPMATTMIPNKLDAIPELDYTTWQLDYKSYILQDLLHNTSPSIDRQFMN